MNLASQFVSPKLAQPTNRVRKVLPTMDQVAVAAQSLPDPESHSADVHEVDLVGEKGALPILFRRIRISGREGKCYRWVYDGKVLV